MPRTQGYSAASDYVMINQLCRHPNRDVHRCVCRSDSSVNREMPTPTIVSKYGIFPVTGVNFSLSDAGGLFARGDRCRQDKPSPATGGAKQTAGQRSWFALVAAFFDFVRRHHASAYRGPRRVAMEPNAEIGLDDTIEAAADALGGRTGGRYRI